MRRDGTARTGMETGQGPAIHKPDGWPTSNKRDLRAALSIDTFSMKRREPALLGGI